ncbi:MAG TPA: M14 metallopeptidase family protein, partial [Kofleriaceae bacterium]|nr:M14 metallopeptidase family protein [Kofleriaceae bacterium]
GLLTGAALLAVPRPASPTRAAIQIDCTVAQHCTFAESLALDVWSEQRGPNLPLDIVVSSDSLARLDAAHVPWQMLDPDIDATARAEAVRLHGPAAAQPADFFADYRDYRAITERMTQLAAAAPDRVRMEGIGSTLDGRTIWALHIGPRNATPMLINGTQHAREWIAAMTTTCVADRLVRDYDRDPAIKKFVDSTSLYVVPVVNPDGYQWSWSNNRYWRKNRRGGFGVDLNRNFSVGWGGTGSSSRQGAEDYRGEAAFSENESAALRDLAKRERIALHVDFHSYGQLLLYPWNYSPQQAKDRARFAAIGDRMASAIYAQHEKSYKLMQGVELYPAAGTLSDWAYGDANALSFTIELRPKMGRGGFVLPPSEIKPTCDEGVAAVLALRAAQP